MKLESSVAKTFRRKQIGKYSSVTQDTLERIRQQLNYRLGGCRAANGTHIEIKQPKHCYL